MWRIILIASLILVGVILAFLLVSANKLVNQYVLWQPGPKEEDPGVLGLPYRKVEIPIENSNLVAWLIPAKQRSDKTILVAPGFDYDLLEIIKDLLFLHGGYNLFIFDPRGQGESKGTYALGAFEAEDIESSLNWLQRYEHQKVAMLGYSCGGTAAIIAAARHPEISAVIVDSPYANLRLAAFKSKVIANPILKPLLPFSYFIASIRLGLNLFMRTNALKAINQVSHVLFIHGTNDKTISFENSELLYERARPPKEIWLTDARHVESIELYPEEYHQRLLSFLARYMK